MIVGWGSKSDRGRFLGCLPTAGGTYEWWNPSPTVVGSWGVCPQPVVLMKGGVQVRPWSVLGGVHSPHFRSQPLSFLSSVFGSGFGLVGVVCWVGVLGRCWVYVLVEVVVGARFAWVGGWFRVVLGHICMHLEHDSPPRTPRPPSTLAH